MDTKIDIFLELANIFPSVGVHFRAHVGWPRKGRIYPPPPAFCSHKQRRDSSRLTFIRFMLRTFDPLSSSSGALLFFSTKIEGNRRGRVWTSNDLIFSLNLMNIVEFHSYIRNIWWAFLEALEFFPFYFNPNADRNVRTHETNLKNTIMKPSKLYEWVID